MLSYDNLDPTSLAFILLISGYFSDSVVSTLVSRFSANRASTRASPYGRHVDSSTSLLRTPGGARTASSIAAGTPHGRFYIFLRSFVIFGWHATSFQFQNLPSLLKFLVPLLKLDTSPLGQCRHIDQGPVDITHFSNNVSLFIIAAFLCFWKLLSYISALLNAPSPLALLNVKYLLY